MYKSKYGLGSGSSWTGYSSGFFSCSSGVMTSGYSYGISGSSYGISSSGSSIGSIISDCSVKNTGASSTGKIFTVKTCESNNLPFLSLTCKVIKFSSFVLK